MEDELLKLITEFTKELRDYNEFKRTAIADEQLPTFENFIKWLVFRKQNKTNG